MKNHCTRLFLSYFSFLLLVVTACHGEQQAKPSPPSKPELQDWWGKSQGPEDRLRSLGYGTDKEELLPLAQGLGIQEPTGDFDSRKFDLRRDAIELLANYPEEPVINALKTIAREEPERLVRDAALFSLARLGDSRALLDIRQEFEDGNPERKVSLALGLAKTGRPEAMQMLREALDVAPVERLSVLIWYLRERGERAGFERLELAFSSVGLVHKLEAIRGLDEFAIGLDALSPQAQQVRSLLWSVLDGSDDAFKKIVLENLSRFCGSAIPYDICIGKLADPDSISPDPGTQEVAIRTKTKLIEQRRFEPVKERLEELVRKRIRDEAEKSAKP